MYTLLITFFLVAIIFSFLCSLWEAVLLSITPAYAQIQDQKGSPLGRQLRHFKTNIDRPLAAILTLNTIAHTVGAIGVGNEASAIWAQTNPVITSVAIPVAMTLAILILSEIIPKTIGATFWKELAPFTVTCLRFVITALAPLVWLSRQITNLLQRDNKDSVLSRSEFLAMTQIGEEAGVFDKSESDIIANLLEFRKVRAKDIMTPRTVVFAADASTSIADFHEENPDFRFSRIPIFEDSKDNVIGFVLKHDTLGELAKDNGANALRSIRRDLLICEEDFPLPELFSRLVRRREHIALVVDEFGGMSGIVTMEDVIETMLGLEIVDESDQSTDMQAHARHQWEERAKTYGLSPETKPPTEEE